MQRESNTDQPFLQGSEHPSANDEAEQNEIKNQPSFLENVPTCFF